MGWREWPYWLKGGLIGLVIAISLFTLSFLSECRNLGVSVNCPFWLFFILVLPYFLISLMIAAISFKLGLTIPTGIILGFIGYSIYILIGAFIGWIYGKIKQRKKQNLNNLQYQR